MNICKLGDAERIYKNAHKGGLERPGFIRDYEILDGILERKNQIHKVVLHNYQKILIDLGSSEKKATQWDPPFPVGSIFARFQAGTRD